MKILSLLILCSLWINVVGQTVKPPFPVKRQETPETWQREGWNALERAKREVVRKGNAKNVILFIGDGMGISTLTASRILEGQLRGESGEENRLSFEDFPFTALSKTYATDHQTSDSAPTMTAIMTGIKTDDGLLSLNQNANRRDYKTAKSNETETLLEMADEKGLSTGVVTTTRVTHATPAACYAHTVERDWESDKNIFDTARDAYEAKVPDIAQQLIEFHYGKGSDGLEVALGGGRTKFLPRETPDPEYTNRNGERLDKRDLTREWLKQSDSAYVWNKQQFDKINPRKTKHLLGLFEPSHMHFEHDRPKDVAGEPSLSEMTAKAIDVLSQNKRGYFLMVEGGRIDHGHHYGNAFRALTETIELSNAVRTALGKVNLDETLIVVTADHSHSLVMQGYSVRGNDLLGLVRTVDDYGKIERDYKKDMLGRPFTTLSYTSGPGYTGTSNDQPEGPKTCCKVPKTFQGITSGRTDLSSVDTTDPDYLQEAIVPLDEEEHGGEDVAIFATGVNAYLVHGSMEENWIFYVMADTLGFKRNNR